MTATAPPDVPVRSLRDILTARERHPECPALRQQLLGEEPLELPALFAKFADGTTRGLDRLTEELEAFDASTTRRLDGLAARGWDPSTASTCSARSRLPRIRRDGPGLRSGFSTIFPATPRSRG